LKAQDVPTLEERTNCGARRMIASHAALLPDEVQEHPEELLKEMSLSSYYDEVALKGLELAARDLARGVLTRPASGAHQGGSDDIG
jgi:hypothetical protein